MNLFSENKSMVIKAKDAKKVSEETLKKLEMGYIYQQIKDAAECGDKQVRVTSLNKLQRKKLIEDGYSVADVSDPGEIAVDVSWY